MGKAKPLNAYGIDPRDLTIEQRRELFLAKKKELSKDRKVLQENSEDRLVPFNRLSLDYGLKLYGLAGGGTVYQFHGDEGSAKTTIAADICTQYQKQTREAIAYFDYERRLKSWYLRAMGLDESMAFITRPDSMEEGVKQAINLMNQGVKLFVFDSIPRMHSKADYESVMNGDAFGMQVGGDARMMKLFYDIILPYIAGIDGTLIMVNQTRSRIEQGNEARMAAKGYHTVTNLNYTLPGGRANRYALSVMVENTKTKAWRPGKHDEFVLEAEPRRGEEYLALEIGHRSLKNTVTGTGWRQAKSYVRPGLGIDENISIREYARNFDLIGNHGKRWYVGESVDNALVVFDNKKLALEALVENEDEELLARLKALVIEKFSEHDSKYSLAEDEDTSRFLAGEQGEFQPEENLAVQSQKLAVDDELA